MSLMDVDIAIVGFGEAGSTFAQAGKWAARARSYDVETGRQAVMRALGVRSCAAPVDAVAGAPLILSLVTADRALAVARSFAPLLPKGAIWCDMNSVAPETKRRAAAAIDAAGGRYVDVAILSPVKPERLAAPLLLSGAAANEARGLLAHIGFLQIRVVGDDVGRASAIKMIRSVMVKGIEALTDEMMLAAEAADVVDEVLSSLDASEKVWNWAERAAYNLERMDRHGARRAAEMEEAMQTLVALGVAPLMTRGTVQRQTGRGHMARNGQAA